MARHIADGDGSTFAGLTETNGYQPLWLLALVPIAVIFRNLNSLVAATVVLQCVLWLGVVREGLRIGRRFGGEVCGIGAVAMLGVLALGVRHLSFNGMESGLLLFLLLVAMRLILEAADDQRLGADVRLGWVFALICLTRLDAGTVVVALAIVALVQTRSSPTPLARRLVGMGAPVLLTLCAYAGLNLAIFGVAQPVSGQAKAVGGPFFNGRTVSETLEVQVMGRPTWLGVVTLALVVAAAVVLRSQSSSSPRHQRLLSLIVAVFAGQVVFVSYVTVFTSYGMLSWYLYHSALLLFLASLAIFDWALRRSATRVGHGIVWLTLVVLVGQAAGAFLADAQVQDGGYAAAGFVEANLPDDAVLAMGDRAGLFGYYSDRPLLQLEGLTADASFIDQLAAGAVPQRMISEGVDYYVRYGSGHRVVPIAWGCSRFEEPAMRDETLFEVVACESDLVYRAHDSDGDVLSIWRFRPELQVDA